MMVASASYPGLGDAVRTTAFEADFPPLSGTDSGNPTEPSSLVLDLPPAPAGGRTRHSRVTRSYRLDRVQIGREAFLSAMALCGVNSAAAMSSPAGQHYATLAGRTGTEAALAYLKEEAGRSRDLWLRGGSTHEAQMSYVGRALPTGTSAQCSAALLQHRQDMTTPWVSDHSQHLCALLREWVRTWCRTKVRGHRFLANPDLPTRSSCYEKTASAGGLRAWFMENRDELDDTDLRRLPEPHSYYALPSCLILTTGWRLRPEGLPRNKVTCLTERGLKTRVVTSGPGSLQLLGHPIRKKLLAGIRRTVSAASPLVGFTDEDATNHFRGAAMEIAVSTDLTRASDLLPLELMGAIVDGLVDASKISPQEEQVLRALTGPQVLQYPDGTEVTSCRGILMGTPTTWTLLTIIHQWWWEEAIRRVANRRGVTLTYARRLNRFMTCGDDALFIGWKDVAAEYKSLVHQCGGVPSPGKHFEITGRQLRAVFLERLYDVIEDPDKPGYCSGLRRLPVVPVRGLVRPELPKELVVGEGAMDVPASLKYLLAVDQALTSNPGCKPALQNWVDRRCSWLYSVAVGILGLVPGVPLSLGGYPMAPTTQYSLEFAARSRSHIAAGGSGISAVIRRVFDRSWQLAEEITTPHIRDLIAEGVMLVAPAGLDTPLPYVGAPSNGCGPWECVGSYPDFLSRKVAGQYILIESNIPSSVSVRHVTHRSLARAIRKRRRVVEALPLPSGGPCVDWQDMCSRIPHDRLWVMRSELPEGSLVLDQSYASAHARYLAQWFQTHCSVASTSPRDPAFQAGPSPGSAH